MVNDDSKPRENLDELWPRIRERFERLCEMGASEREQALRHLEQNEPPGVAKAVRDLLDRNDVVSNPSDFLEPPIPGSALRLLAHRNAEARIGERLGPYRLQSLIAVGGMGSVYRADRIDEQFEMEVAVKILHRDLGGEEHRRAFERERRLLAQLNHPNICRLFDGGTTHDGSPYLIMEFIEGRPLLTFCEERRLPLEARLELAQRICQAVHFAHRNLVLHRDLKPSNLLVTEEGHLKIIDFGIGTGLDGSDEPTPPRSLDKPSPAVGLTRPYASPEQLKNLDLTTASDVYSLGVVFRELIGEPRPSEVESILDRATAPEPQDRAPSAADLGAEIEAFLHGRPVRTYSTAGSYVLRKFVARHRFASISVGIAILGITLFSVVISLLARNLDHERETAVQARHNEEEARRETDRINLFLMDTLKTASPDKMGGSASILQALANAGARIESELSEEPRIAVRAHLTIADTYSSLGMTFKAEPHLRSALKLLSRRPGMERDYGKTLRRLGTVLSYQNRPEGLELQQESLEVLRRLPQNTETEMEVARSLHSLGFALYRCVRPPKFDEAREKIEEALEIFRRIPDADLELRRARCLHTLAALELRRGNVEKSHSHYQEAIVLYSKNQTEEFSSEAIECRTDAAICVAQLGCYDEAIDELNEVLVQSDGRFGEAWSMHIFNLIGSFLQSDGQRRKADASFRKALSLQCELLAKRMPSLTETLLAHSARIAEEGTFATEAPPEAIVEMVALLGPHTETIEKNGVPYATALLGIARGMTRANRNLDVAENLLTEVLRLGTQALSEGDWALAATRRELGLCYLTQGRTEEAIPLLEHAYEELKSSLGEAHWETREALHALQTARP